MYRHRLYNTNEYCSNLYDMNLDRVTGSQAETMNVLDDTQEFLSNGLHKYLLIMIKTPQKFRF
jgi:hypothetical protein